MAAARHKRKWSGGVPVLGYDIDVQTKKLGVNEAEAARVRAIFDLYLEYRSLLPVVEDLGWRGWCTKQSAPRGLSRLTSVSTEPTTAALEGVRLPRCGRTPHPTKDTDRVPRAG